MQEDLEKELRRLVFSMQCMEGVGCVSIWKLLGKCNAKCGRMAREWEGLFDILTMNDEEIKKHVGLHKANIVKTMAKKYAAGGNLHYENTLREKGIGYCIYWDEEYPEPLRNLPDPPIGLFYIGALPQNHHYMVAVIGARLCSEYGKYAARVYAGCLAEHGAGIVSGLAAGIDGIAQKVAVQRGGYSVGVLGCGVDVCYPPENEEIYAMLAKQGCILSEYPPGTPPKQQNFPMRNRIISGLSDAILVIEARAKSGTLITADLGLEQGKDIYALPGRVNDALSFGCNRLIWQGAGIAVTPELLVESLGLTGENDTEGERLTMDRADDATTPCDAGTTESIILEILDLTPRNIGEILTSLTLKTGQQATVGEVSAVLLKLEIAGYVSQNAGYFTRKM